VRACVRARAGDDDGGDGQASLATSSRALWAMGGGCPDEIPHPMAPRFFAKSWTLKNGTQVRMWRARRRASKCTTHARTHTHAHTHTHA
jgi:hypothetical protein